MVGVVGSSPIAPTKHRKHNQSLQQKCPLTSGHFCFQGSAQVRKRSRAWVAPLCIDHCLPCGIAALKILKKQAIRWQVPAEGGCLDGAGPVAARLWPGCCMEWLVHALTLAWLEEALRTVLSWPLPYRLIRGRKLWPAKKRCHPWPVEAWSSSGACRFMLLKKRAPSAHAAWFLM